MPSKFTAKQRLKLVERAIRGEKISSLCQEFGISRTLLYRWIKRHREDQRKNKILALRPKKRHISLSLRTPPDKIKLILEIVQAHPEFSVTKIVQALPKGSPTGSPVVGHHGVQKVLERLNLNTIEKRQNYQKQPQILQYPPDVYTANIPEHSTIGYKSIRTEILGLPRGELRPQDRLAMIERVKLGEPVAKVCWLYGVSRTIFYRWLKRYEEAPEGKKLEALWDKEPKVEKYFNQTPEEYEQAVLAAVRQYPELSSHRLVGVLPQVGGRPVLGNHGIQNVLRRYNLSTYEQRFAYARAYHKPTFVTPFLGVFQTVLSFVSSLTPQLRGFVVKGSFVVAIGIFVGVIIYGINSFVGLLTATPTLSLSLGMVFSLLALSFGMFFFLYSLKYYFTIAAVLSFSRRSLKEGIQETHGSFWAKIFGGANDNHNNNNATNGKQPIFAGGLQPDLSKIVLQSKPFVSIHLATYNEKRVIERLLTAATSMEYENYEVVLVDDSTDETMEILKKWADHPRVKLIHRDSREGFKGGALGVALKHTNPKAEFVLVFDADFIPYPDTIVQFLKYFQNLAGSLGKEDLKNTNIAAIQGYQWHVLNKSENWVTRGVRSEYAGSYVIERSGTEIYQGLKQIAGSAYMMRADVLHQLGWGNSITEDFELTLKLYEQGYKVVYTPYIQAPAEAVATIRRLIRQRMRWAEGHSHNIKKMFFRLLGSPKLTLFEKLEFLYMSPYYLQAALFILGSFLWFLAEVVFRVRLPFWTELWGWSLILTNFFALPLMNMIGLFLEEAEEKDYLGLFSFIALSYIVAPFQGYAAVKGFLSKEEGPWFRTPKTGKITDIFTRGRFYRWIAGILPGRVAPSHRLALSPYVSLATANNQFSNFKIRPKRLRWISKTVLAILLCFTVTFYTLAHNVSLVYATNPTGTFRLHDAASAVLTTPASWQLQDANDTTSSTATSIKYAKSATLTARFRPGAANNTTSEDPTSVAPDYGWIFDTPFGSGGTIASGTWNFTICRTGTDTAGDFGYLRVRVYNVDVSAGSITASTQLYDSGTAFSATDITLGTTASNISLTSASIGPFTTSRQYLFVDYFLIMTTNDSSSVNDKVTFNAGLTTCTTSPRVVTPAVTIPENLMYLIFFIPFVPFLARKFKFKLSLKGNIVDKA